CALAVALVLGGALAVRERRSRRPLIPRELTADPRFIAATAGGGLLNFAFYGELFFLSLFLQQERGLDPLQTGLAFLPQPVAFPAVAGGVMGAAPQALAGIASAAFTAGRQVGGVLGVAVLGGIATAGGHAQVGGMRRALVIAALALAAAAALSPRLAEVRSD